LADSDVQRRAAEAPKADEHCVHECLQAIQFKNWLHHHDARRFKPQDWNSSTLTLCCENAHCDWT